MFAYLRDFLVLGVGLVLVVTLTFVSSRASYVAIVAAPEDSPLVAEVSTTTEPISPRVEDAPRPTTTPTTTQAVTKPQASPAPSPTPAPKPAPKPAEKPAPKVDDLGITLDDAINSINALATSQSTSSQSVNDRVRAALVNIICTSDASGPFESISGSGILIDPRGVILTNAHVAQFFLLKDYPTPGFVDCTIRTGSPAYPRYTAELMFLPPSWIRDNAQKIDDEAPRGTGERDYALLRITGAVSPSVTLPPLFPYLLVSTDAPSVGDQVLQAGYAAGFLGGITIQNELYASTAWTTIRDIFTFNANTVDLISLGGSVVAQSGSSGGPVVNQNAIVVGVIVTSSGTGDTSTRNLHAITSSYIVRDFESERGKSLSQALSSDLASEVSIFTQVYAPSAKAALVAELEK